MSMPMNESLKLSNMKHFRCSICKH